ncbi:MAG: chalcone isomerase family protein [Rubrivivax sp.]
MLRSLLFGIALAAAIPAQAAEVAGVNYPAQVTVAGRPLVLNGAGIRYRFVVKVYTAGLYLPAKAETAEQALAMPGAKRIHIQMLREIDSNTLGKLFTRGMEDNSSRAEFGKAIPGTLKLAELFVAKKKLAPGEHFTVEYVPDRGTMILVNGQPGLTEWIKEPEFFTSMLKIWLGPKPADELLKSALLGQDPQSNSGN